MTRPSRTIVLITGAFISHHCWDQWIPFFEGSGFKVIAPPWPHKNDTPEALRNQDLVGNIATNRLSAIVEFFRNIVKEQNEKPILIGHSIGGLIVQLLMQEDLGSVGVAIHSVPPQGIMTFKLSFLKAGWGPLGFFTPVKKAFMMSFQQWQYAFTNGMSLEHQKASYYALAIPESKMIVRDTITSVAKVNFDKPHLPLLFIAGSQDHTIPASLNRKNFEKYKNITSVTDYKEFQFANHYVLGHPCWKEVSEFILKWINMTQVKINA